MLICQQTRYVPNYLKNVHIGVDATFLLCVWLSIYYCYQTYLFDLDKRLFAVIKIKERGIGVRWGGADIVK